MKRVATFLEALYRLYEHSGFALAGAVAFSFIVSIFPFFIFLGALSGVFLGRDIASAAVLQLFDILPRPVAEGLAPEIQAIMGTSRPDLLTASGFLALFFATSAIETMRAALNGAYRVHETRAYPLCLVISMGFVLVSAISALILTWAIVVGPALAGRLQPEWTKHVLEIGWIADAWRFFEQIWVGPVARYALGALIIGLQLFAFHMWLAAGKRRFQDVWPGVVLSIVLWLGLAALWSKYLAITNYSFFYAGLSQLMIALIFFQFSAITILLGAELNRGIMEYKRIARGHAAGTAAP